MPEDDPSPPSAVADATVLIYLAKLDRLADLWRRFEDILVPAPVHEEIVREGKRLEHPDAIRVEAALDEGKLTLADPVPVPDELEAIGLEHEDAAVLALAEEEQIGTMLSDDRGLRAVARNMGLQTKGTLAFLVEALKRGELSFSAYLEELEALVDHGFRLSTELYARAVRRGRQIAGET